MRGGKQRRLIRREPRSLFRWSCFFWFLHLFPGYLYFFVALSFLLGHERRPAVAIVFLVFWFVPAIIATLLERRQRTHP
jgi:hypothetical protein